MIPLRMRPDDAHCGPVAIASVLRTTPADIMDQWPTKWTDPKSDRWLGLWPIDTPWQHRKFLEDIRGRHMVLQRKGDPFPAQGIALLHNCEWGRNPLTKFLGALLMQHWVVILEDAEDYIVVDYGTEVNPVRTFTRERFEAMVDSGWPRCVYSVR